ncbi:MAG: flagellar hook-length control protein FliK, partial [Sulfuritalea sp.]|nr:flagellar hook-length control protein FliK [Sulfuritalea sp.]
LPLAPASSTDLAQRLPSQLAQAVTTSGLFYEAHQVEWALGQRTLMSLLAEPQGQHSRAEVIAAWGQGNGALRSAILAQLATGEETQATRPQVSLLRALFGGEIAAAAAATEEASPAPSQAVASAIPEELRPLVQQQLEAAATQRLAWHGEIWPRQFLEWDIERDPAHAESAAAEIAVWHTTLRLQLPRLGEIEARIRLSGQNLELVLQAADPASATDLQSAVPGLQQALAAVGLTLTAAQAQSRHDEA